MSDSSNEEFRKLLIRLIDHKIDESKRVNNSGISGLSELQKVLLDPEPYKEEYPSNPGEPSLNNIESTGETALQRALINNGRTVLSGDEKEEEVQWWDLEVPVVMNQNPRRMAIDLVGYSAKNPVLCELKFTKEGQSPTEHPWYAIFELLVYRYLILENYEKLDRHQVHHGIKEGFSWKDIGESASPHLLVAANKTYWDYWFQKRSKQWLDTTFLKELSLISTVLEVNIWLYETEDEDFEAQKGGQNKYTPHLTSENWTQITFT